MYSNVQSYVESVNVNCFKGLYIMKAVISVLVVIKGSHHIYIFNLLAS